MRILEVYASLYLECFQKALRGIAKNPWTLLLPMGLAAVWVLAIGIASRLGMIGGILISLTIAALGSCYLYFVGDVVAGSPVRLSELKRSAGTYFWAVINVMFIFWIARIAITLLGGPSAGALMVALYWVSLIAFNAVPETLYLQNTHGGLATLQSSFEFLRDQLIPWAIPNVLLFGAFIGLSTVLSLLGPLSLFAVPVIVGALIHVGMVFRGHVYKALRTSSHRQRMFRYGERT